MLQIILCEDDPKQRAHLENIMEDYVKDKADLVLALSVGTPQELLHFLEHKPDRKGVYFLDIDLQQELTGIDLAMRIREKDAGAKIVFITTHAKMTTLVFRHKIEALDFIVKDRDDIKKRVEECLDIAFVRLQEQLASPEEVYAISTGKHVTKVPIDQILFFETDPASRHKIILHTKDGQITFRGTIKDALQAHVDFFLCHRSIAVHVKNIKSVNKTLKLVEMTNGETAPIAPRRMAELLELL